MHVQMRYFLNTGLARIRDQTKAPLFDTCHATHLADGTGIIEDFGIRRLLREVIVADVWTFGDHQHMHGCLRLDVVKRKTVSGFTNGLVGDSAAQDLGEDVLVVIAVWHEVVLNLRTDALSRPPVTPCHSRHQGTEREGPRDVPAHRLRAGSCDVRIPRRGYGRFRN